MKEYVDVFSWKYEDLKTYDKNIIHHKIPIKSNTNPFKQKLCHVNPIFLPIIEKEIKKLMDEKIIVPLRFSNLVWVRNKSGEIRLCVDFRNRNICSFKDTYPFPKMDHILQIVVGSKRIPMIDGFSRYN